MVNPPSKITNRSHVPSFSIPPGVPDTFHACKRRAAQRQICANCLSNDLDRLRFPRLRRGILVNPPSEAWNFCDDCGAWSKGRFSVCRKPIGLWASEVKKPVIRTPYVPVQKLVGSMSIPAKKCITTCNVGQIQMMTIVIVVIEW